VLHVVESDPAAIVVLPENLDDLEALRHAGERLDACVRARCAEIVVDCGAVRTFSPPAVGWLVSAGRAMHDTGGRLVLRHVGPELAREINALHFDLDRRTCDAA